MPRSKQSIAAQLARVSIYLSREHAEPGVTLPTGPTANQVCTTSHIRISLIALGLKEGCIYCLGVVHLFLLRISSLQRKHLCPTANMNILYHVPSLMPPAGVTSNFVNPESQALMVIVTSILCLVLISLISTLRFYTNLCIKRSFKADDSKYRSAPFNASH